MNYGFNEKLVEIKPEDYKLGFLPKYKIMEDGQWDVYLPLYEPQARLYETWGCTVWGAQNQIEIYLKRVLGIEENYDERFNYILAGVDVGGANPQDAYESIRKDGLKDDEPMPATFAEFKDNKYITSGRRRKAKMWLRRFTFKHEWLEEPTREQIVEYLKYSPIAISVTAWHEKDGLYIDRGLRNNHWCVCYGYKEDERGILLKVFDSYDRSKKILHPDHKTKFGKRIWVYETPKEGSIWQKILALLREMF